LLLSLKGSNSSSRRARHRLLNESCSAWQQADGRDAMRDDDVVTAASLSSPN
jgi:hypothetical protein